MRWFGLALSFSVVVSTGPLAAAIPDALTGSAEYYYNKQDYAQALPLWEQILDQQPENVTALTRVCEMKVLREGRGPCREVLGKSLNSPWGRTVEGRRALAELLDRFLNQFMTEDGQSAYLIGMARLQTNDFATALTSLQHAQSLERGNARILRAQAKCERQLKRWEGLYQTLSQLTETHPLDFSQWDDWLESLIYRRQFATVTSEVKRRGEELISLRQRAALGIALVEQKEDALALPILQGLVARDKSAYVHPIVWWGLAQIFSRRPASQSEALLTVEKFVSVLKRPEAALIDGLDPYRSDEAKESAEKLLAELKAHTVRSR